MPGSLVGQDSLEAPWLGLAKATLIAASICAIFVGVRAIQATMLTFGRTPPNAVTRIYERRGKTATEVQRRYLAALMVAQRRAIVVGDWKVDRLRGARRWFMGLVGGVVVLTILVLISPS